MELEMNEAQVHNDVTGKPFAGLHRSQRLCEREERPMPQMMLVIQDQIIGPHTPCTPLIGIA